MSFNWKTESGEKFELHAENILAPLYQYFIKDIEQMWQHSIRDKIVLEIGCGPGFMTEQLCLAGAAHVIALDVSSGMLNRARLRNKRFSQVSYIVADASEIPLKNKTVELVFSRGSIFFWKDIDKSVKEISRCLADHGITLIGGGYGISTPKELLDKVLQNIDKSSKSSIPRLNLDDLLETAMRYNSVCEIISKPKRGFWLKALQPKN